MYLLNTFIIISPWINGFYFLRLLIDTYIGPDIVSKIITMSVLEDLSVIVINVTGPCASTLPPTSQAQAHTFHTIPATLELSIVGQKRGRREGGLEHWNMHCNK